jgi:hypothetical protein
MTTTTGLTVNPGTSTIKINDASATDKTFNGGGKTFYNVWCTGAGTGIFEFTTAATFNEFKVDTPPHTIKITNAITVSMSRLVAYGTRTNLMTFDTVSGSGTFTLSCANPLQATYCSITRSVAPTGSLAHVSTNGGSNSNWTFV